MPENVRLLVWDLDETFWHGTLTEGGITIRQENCDLVRELARRGIVSSICSKNDLGEVQRVLEHAGIWDYFVFPSVNWATKGPRVAAIVDAIQLRAATVMFIDDNPANLNEVKDALPDIQVRGHDFIPQILSDPLFAGKADPELTRLRQYKLLETRSSDLHATGGDNIGFLRASDIRVYIEYDVERHLDRAIELINRTNQLNFTKRRLPEDTEAARQALTAQTKGFFSEAGLVRVMDKYGDHGFVGFYLSQMGRSAYVKDAAWRKLVHYCFSCRTLGMYIEQWLYEHLQRPELTVSGKVLTDLSEPRAIDWVRLVSSPEEGLTDIPRIGPEIRVHGGCEAHALAHYVHSRFDDVKVTANFASGGLFVRVSAVALLLSASERATPAFEAEARAMDVPYDILAADYFGDAPRGTVFVFKGDMDEAESLFRYRHKTHGWELKIEPDTMALFDLVGHSEEECLAAITARKFPPLEEERIIRVVRHIRENYTKVTRGSDARLEQQMRSMFERVPVGSRMIVLLSPDRAHFPDKSYKTAPWIAHYNEVITRLVEPYPFVATVCFGDHLESEADDHGSGHFDRLVYHRVAARIAAVSETLPAKEAATQDSRPALSAVS